MKADRWTEIQRLYEAAVNLTPEQRERFLMDACADEDIRREIESLLQHRENPASFLERPALDVAADLITRDQPGTLLGRSLGPYELRAYVGAGGMGEVYRARDARLDRDVAIKVSGEKFSERFEREARAIASLNHPNICTLYDVGAIIS
jgi:serine/threonine protein kinase